MAKLITISALKGGVGKSTLVYNLAHYYRSKKLQVVVVDCDVGQFSVLNNLNKETGIQLLSREQIRSWEEFAEGARKSTRDLVLIDTGPYRTLNELREIHQISDLVVIPTRASKFDIDSLKDTMEVYTAAFRASKGPQKPQAAIVLTMSRRNVKLYKELRKALEGRNYPLLQTEMEFRSAWEASVGSPGGLLKTKPKDKKALAELTGIAEELLEKTLSNGKKNLLNLLNPTFLIPFQTFPIHKMSKCPKRSASNSRQMPTKRVVNGILGTGPPNEYSTNFP